MGEGMAEGLVVKEMEVKVRVGLEMKVVEEGGGGLGGEREGGGLGGGGASRRVAGSRCCVGAAARTCASACLTMEVSRVALSLTLSGLPAASLVFVALAPSLMLGS